MKEHFKKWKYLYLILLILLIIWIIIKIRQMKNTSSKENGSTGTSSATNSGSNNSSGYSTLGSELGNLVLNKSKMLQKGSTGAEVKELQKLINQTGANPTLATDGIFGKRTEDALVKVFGYNGADLNTIEMAIWWNDYTANASY